MKRVQSKRMGRPGFTLVEMLIVIAIIAILVGLISAAVNKARIKVFEVRNRSEISQLAVALEVFHSKYGVYPPSRIKLAERLNASTYPQKDQPGTLDNDSVLFISSMFKQITTAWSDPSPAGGIDWNGDGVTPADAVWNLEGDQCLVFFLGGIPAATSPPACTGFSTNPRNPAFHVKNGGDVVGPFYEFQSNRLVLLPGVLPNLQRSPRHFSYLDTYGKRPYAYFSSYKRRDGYNKYYNPTAYPLSDCPSLLQDASVTPNVAQLPKLCVWPLAESMGPPVRYLNHETFQIISAGADAKFGSGTILPVGGPVWTPVTAANVYPENPNGGGNDDQSNFYENLLGVEGR